MEYLTGIKGNPMARAVKLADILDNSDPARLAKLPAGVADRLKTKYAKAYSYLMG